MTIANEMTAITISVPGGPEGLRATRLPVPMPGPGEVLIRVAAAGVNYPDLLQRRGHYDPPPGASPLLGLEVSGEIFALGEGATGFAVGDRVIALCNGGGYAEYVAMPAGQVLPLPEGWRLSAAAALPETFFTIEQTLVLRAGVKPGMDVLVHGGAGGIGGAAIQIAKALGARPIAVVSSDEKAAYVKTLGAAEVINHTSEDFVARALELTGGKGADRIVSIAGGDSLQRNIAASALNGVIVQLAGLSGNKAELDIGSLLRKNLTLIGSVLRPQPNEAKAAIAAGLLRDIWPALADRRIIPPRIRAWPLAEAAAAHAALEQRWSYGKIILITPWGETQASDNSVANT
jgi:NADPH:quinone reductase